MSAHSAGYEARAAAALKEAVVYVTSTERYEDFSTDGLYFKVSSGISSMRAPAITQIPIGFTCIIDNLDNGDTFEILHTGGTSTTVNATSITLVVFTGDNAYGEELATLN